MFDAIRRGGTVVDGLRGAPYAADIGIADSKIGKIGKICSPSRREVDADGAVVTPGFINVCDDLFDASPRLAGSA
jgi:N-acyl-D-amino-acid deacylase